MTRPLRSGLLDDQAAHAQPRRASPLVPGRRQRGQHGGRAVRPARFFPEIADQLGTRYGAAFQRLRSVRRRQDRAENPAASKYYRQYDADPFMPYADAGRRTENRNWFDCDLVRQAPPARTLHAPTNNDGIAQDNEIGPGRANFGAARRSHRGRSSASVQLGIHRRVQHQVAPRLAVGAMVYKRQVRNIQLPDQDANQPCDYTSFTMPMPDFSNDPTLKGVLDANEILTVYNLNTAKRTVFNAPIVDTAAPDDKSLYTGFETYFSLRIPGTTLFGSWTAEHNMSVFCNNNDNPNGVTTNDLYRAQRCLPVDDSAIRRKFRRAPSPRVQAGRQLPASKGRHRHRLRDPSFPGADRVITYQPAADPLPRRPHATPRRSC